MGTNGRPHFPFRSFQSIAIRGAILLHAVGLLGLIFFKDLFLPLTPFLLLIVTSLLFADHRDHRPRFWFFSLGVVLAGMTIEILGVRTGAIFGDYHYTGVFGPAIAGVPLLIGVNWLFLTYLTAQASGSLVRHPFLTPLIGAIFMVGVDVLLEPVAYKMDFWVWEKGMPPSENYSAWFITSFLFHFTAWKLGLSFRSRLGIPLLIILLLFFGSIILIA